MQMEQKQQKQNLEYMLFKLSLTDNSPEEMVGNIVTVDSAKNLLRFHSENIESISSPDGGVVFNTGLSNVPIQRNKYLSPEDKEALLKLQKEAYKKVAKFLHGDEKAKVNESNKEFWFKSEYGKFDFTNDTLNLVFNTENVKDLLFYLQIACGSYQLIAFNRDEAEAKSSPYFLQLLEDAESRESVDEMEKVDAYGAIGILKTEGNQEALMYLCWSLGDRNDKMWGFNKNSSIPVMVKALTNYLEGKTKNNKRGANSVREFMKSYGEWKVDRDTFMIKVIIRIADYQGIIDMDESKTYEIKRGEFAGVKLDKTLNGTIEKLKKGVNQEILEHLRTQVSLALTNDL